jgi:Tfp pilus assembly protein PilN
MIEINLLPKGYRKKSLNLSFGKAGVYVAVGAAAIVLMLGAVTFYQMGQISDLDDNIARASKRADDLKKDIQMVDALMDVKSKISNRMSAVDNLDGHRSAWVRILEDISRNVPDFIWMARFEEIAIATPDAKTQKGSETTAANTAVTSTGEPTVRDIEVEGYAFTLNSLAAYMINMMRSDYFTDVELVSIEEVTFADQEAYDFVVQGRLHYLSDEELRRMIAQQEVDGKSEDNQTGHKTLN